MFLESQRRVNLSLPTGYNRCSLEQLRAIASVIISLSAQADVLHPFSMEDIKTGAFFLLAGLEIVSPLNPRVPVEDQYYMVRFKHNRIKTSFNRIMKRNEPFALYLWQVNSWLGKRKPRGGREIPGMLDWMNVDSRNFFTVFPFEIVSRHRGLFHTKKFHGPEPMLDGFSWQRYRFAQDFMKNYVEQQNMLVSMQKMGVKVSANDMISAYHHVDTAKALFLANIFDECIDYTDDDTGLVRHDWHYQSNQASDNCEYFRHFPDVDWQIVLLWWSGIMAWLGHTYPKVFKKQDTKEQKYVNPLELYARTTATIEKYVGINADDVEREPYTTVLQQMQDMAMQNEEMERIKAK